MAARSKGAVRKSARGESKKANVEVEVKLRVADRRGVLRQLAKLGAEVTMGRVHEMNMLYDTPDGRLLRQGRMLRVRVERWTGKREQGGRTAKDKVGADEMAGLCAVLTYKGPGSRAKGGGKAEGASPYKIREEHELRISNYEEIERILEGLGLRRSFRYEKFRTTYGLPGMKQLKVEFDETPIGVFIELEGPRGEIDRAAGRLGFSREEYIKLSYGALFLQECGRGHKRKSGGTGGEESDGASQNEPIRFSGIPDMLFRRSK